MSVFEPDRNLQILIVSAISFRLSIPVCYFIHYDPTKEKSRSTRCRSKNANIFKNSKFYRKKTESTFPFLVAEVIKLTKKISSPFK